MVARQQQSSLRFRFIILLVRPKGSLFFAFQRKKAAAGGKGLQCKGGRGEGWCQYIEIETTALAGCKSVTTAGGGGGSRTRGILLR